MIRLLFSIVIILNGFQYAQQLNELRAVWLTNVASDVLESDESIAEAMDYLASININVVFPVVYNKGYTIYPSSIMDSLFNQPVIPGDAFNSRDYLKRLIIEAHRNGIEVIPWFEYGFSSSYSLNGGHIVERFPDWAAKDNTGNLMVKNGFDWLAGTNPDVQDYMLSLILEVIDNYDVDGVQGDDRLPAMPREAGYDSVTVEIYKSEHNGSSPPNDYTNSAWMKWRADKLTDYLERIKDSVKSRSDNLILSVSPTPYYWGYREYLQDSKSWAKQDLLDNIVPQLYQYNMTDYNFALNSTWTDVGQYDREDFFAGILMNIGTYVISPALLGQMVGANRNRNVAGESFFFYEGLRKNNNELGEYLKSSFYSDPALLPYRRGRVWRPRGKIINESDSIVITAGDWEPYDLNGFDNGILRTNDVTGYSSIEYYAEIKDEAWYDIYVYKTPDEKFFNNTRHVIYSMEDSVAAYIDQSNTAEKGWHKIGTSYFPEGNNKVLKIDNTMLASGQYIAADAVMVMLNRKLSPDVIVSLSDNSGDLIIRPNNIQLGQNYPNPFNPSTSISYYIPESASGDSISLMVFDVLGRKLVTLVEEVSPAGTYKVAFDAAGYSSGVYYYSLRVGNKSVTKKMVVLK